MPQAARHLLCTLDAMLRFLLILLFSTLSSHSVAEVPGCPGAESRSYQLHSWQQVRNYFKRYKGWCIDGALGEGVSESVTRLLDNNWSSYSDLQALATKDARFAEWVAMRFKGYPEDECAILRGISNLDNSCPKDAQELCNTLANTGRKAVNPELRLFCAPNPSFQGTRRDEAAARP